jgi:hypothetical protein
MYACILTYMRVCIRREKHVRVSERPRLRKREIESVGGTRDRVREESDMRISDEERGRDLARTTDRKTEKRRHRDTQRDREKYGLKETDLKIQTDRERDRDREGEREAEGT